MMMGGGGGGASREVGTVTGGMALMNFDEKTKPYTRQDLINFMKDYDKNLSEEEMRLFEKGMAGTFIGMPAAYYATWRFSRRMAWHRVQKVVPYPWIPKAGRVCLSLTAATLPYIAVQSWFVNAVLALDNNSLLAFHLKRFMITQRNGMMFARTATREVTREEQNLLSQQATEQTISNRMANRPSAASSGGMDVNLALGQQVMLPVAQTGYKPMPKQS
mmetsp:Transcript_23270/g.26967  ORF Transcript_23270/g.26967 Transcript_23270/m.26967 type:complete len:218 (+) Transcript_23270:43-696(+)|eukprot:CAMPEP_0176435276 /NCGR_PEP_ID=MMETSP0127-20121128/17210_1 /TAXON_ID=938130 /ORGANISM="Platyophrya macrostoma, Strain WH" /LENGTH=217 /DNA_ID=CAMNT_0017818241 /DNA_START=27 /DNA_END=680 /DNA_ORIENTATION=+